MISSTLVLFAAQLASPAAAFRIPALQSALPAALHSRSSISPLFSPMLETSRLCGDVKSLRVDVGRPQVLSFRMNAPADWNKLEVVSNTKAADGHQRILISGGLVYPTYTIPGN